MKKIILGQIGQNILVNRTRRFTKKRLRHIRSFEELERKKNDQND